MSLFDSDEQGSAINSNNSHVYFKPNLTEEVWKWIRANYRIKFKVKDIAEYETSVEVMHPKEAQVNQEMHDYIIDRLKEVRIEEPKQRKTHREVVTREVQITEEREESMNLASDDDTCKTSNKSTEEENSLDSITQNSKSTIQSKIINDSQNAVEKLQESHNRIMQQISYLEDIIVELSDQDDSLVQHSKCSKAAQKIKKKCSPLKNEQNEDEDSVEGKL